MPSKSGNAAQIQAATSTPPQNATLLPKDLNKGQAVGSCCAIYENYDLWGINSPTRLWLSVQTANLAKNQNIWQCKLFERSRKGQHNVINIVNPFAHANANRVIAKNIIGLHVIVLMCKSKLKLTAAIIIINILIFVPNE